MSASDNDVATRISVNETCLVPGGRQCTKEATFSVRQFAEVVGRNSHTLDGSLVGNACGQFKGVGGLALVACLIVTAHEAVHDDATPVHAAYGIATEWVHGQLEGFLLCVVFGKVDILRGENGFRSHVVGVHSFPATGYRAAMKDNLQAIAVGIKKDVLIKAYGLLLVASEEVYLDSLHANLFQPRHLSVAADAVVHAVARSLRSVVPGSVGVVPQQE